MQILFLTRRFYPEIGGVERHVEELSNELIKIGHTVTIITELHQTISKKNKKIYQSSRFSDKSAIDSLWPVKSSYFERELYKGIEVIRFEAGVNDWKKKFRIWLWFLKHNNIIKKYDVIHCHDVFFWYLPLRLINVGKKAFTTFHGYESYPISMKSIIIRKLSEMLSAGSICVGEFIKKWYYASPDYVIYGGVRSVKKTKSIEKPIALFFGRLDEQTGIKTYADASEKLKKIIPGFRLDIYGEGEYKSKLKGSVRKPNNNIEKVITNYRFIFVSSYLSILESLAAGKTVFATYDNPLKRDYLLNSPFRNYISITDGENSLVNAVEYLYTNTKYEQNRVKKGYNWAQKQSWLKVAEIYIKLWKK